MQFLESHSFQAVQESGHDDGAEDTQLGVALDLLLVPEDATEGAEGLRGLADSRVYLGACSSDTMLPRY